MPAPRHPWRWIGAVAIAGAVIAALLALRAATSSDEAPPRATASGEPASDASPRPPAPPPASDAEQAAGLVASARAETASGRFAEARDLLTRAYALDPAPATLLELGRVDARAGRCRDARRAVQRALETASGPLADEARAVLAEIGRCD
jgi:tetratricopeptide (TPR) repeat protein